MSNSELIARVAKDHSLDPELVKRVLSSTASTMIQVLGDEGDQITIKGLGTFTPRKYTVRKGELEFGGIGAGGQRLRVVFKLTSTVRQKLNEIWEHSQGVMK